MDIKDSVTIRTATPADAQATFKYLCSFMLEHHPQLPLNMTFLLQKNLLPELNILCKNTLIS